MLSLANAVAVALSGWLQEKILAGDLSYWVIFLLTGIPPLFTAVVGYLNIDERPVPRSTRATKSRRRLSGQQGPRGMRDRLRSAQTWIQSFVRENRLLLLVLFIVLWNFSPSIGYIERSYLIDVRDFSPAAFGTILTAQALTFLLSILTYRWILRQWPLSLRHDRNHGSGVSSELFLLPRSGPEYALQPVDRQTAGHFRQNHNKNSNQRPNDCR
jgi:hypothetical protein